MGKKAGLFALDKRSTFKSEWQCMPAVLCKVRQCPLRRLSAPDGARATWQGGLLVWPVDKEEPQMMLLQRDRRRRRMWGVFRRGSTWGQHSGQVYLITGVPNSSSQQASTDHGGLYLQWHYPVQHGQLHGDLEKNHFASLEVIYVHHAKSSLYD